MTYSEQLERAAERDRAEIEETLDELRTRLKPGQLIDQFMDYARDGSGGQFYENLKRQIVDNPVPVTMIGAGLAWLAISGSVSHRRRSSLGDSWRGRDRGDGMHSESLERAEDGMRRFGDGMSETAREAAEAFGDGYRSAAGTAREGAENLREGVGAMRRRAAAASSAIGDRVSSAADSVGDAAMRARSSVNSSMSRARRSISDGSHALAEFSREQPLVVAAIGVAVGAALGAALPSTEAESRVMGDAADGAKARVRDVVDEQAKRAKGVAEDLAQHAIGEARETASSVLDHMDRESEPGSDDGNPEERGMRGDGATSLEDDTGDSERRFTAGERPSNG
ncbi:MAG: DUF3618 domain-containing protein [Gemmatimonas sp.]